MITNDIPAVPRFLMREADHHVLQAMVRDEAGRQDAGHSLPDDKDGVVVPALDLASVDLFAPAETRPSGTTDEVASPRIALASATLSKNGYSVEDLALFRKLTGYRLDTRTNIWRAIDEGGNRVPTADRLFATLTEEAFRLADKHRHLGGPAHRDLTIGDLVLTLSSIRRAANSIGSRGLIAFERLEAAILNFSEETQEVIELAE